MVRRGFSKAAGRLLELIAFGAKRLDLPHERLAGRSSDEPAAALWTAIDSDILVRDFHSVTEQCYGPERRSTTYHVRMRRDRAPVRRQALPDRHPSLALLACGGLR